MTDTTEQIRAKIAHILGIFPILSPSMLQVALGTSLPSTLWKPLLEDMVAEGIVLRQAVSTETPAGRQQSYTTLSLAPAKEESSAA